LLLKGLPMKEHVIEIDEDGKVHGNDLESEIASALNRFSAENRSNTPDFILARYLLACLSAFDGASREREQWYGKSLRIGGDEPATSADAGATPPEQGATESAQESSSTTVTGETPEGWQPADV
jgi:hypothetical protein